MGEERETCGGRNDPRPAVPLRWTATLDPHREGSTMTASFAKDAWARFTTASTVANNLSNSVWAKVTGGSTIARTFGKAFFTPARATILLMFVVLALVVLSKTAFSAQSWGERLSVVGLRDPQFFSEVELPLTKIFHKPATVGLKGVNSSIKSYAVCLLVTIGDDTDLPNAGALPFTLIHRLFQAVLKVAGRDAEVEPDLPGAFVGVDYTSLVCKMVRDSLGPSAECRSFRDAPASEKVKCGTLVVGQTSNHIQQASSEWTKKMFWDRLHLVDLDGNDPAAQVLVVSKWQPTIVTGFSRNHYRVGLLLLRSIGKAALHRSVAKHKISVVVWALEDFTPAETNHLNCVIQELNDLYHVPAEVRQYNLSAYPVWMRINASLIQFHDGGKGEYSWKAVITNTVVRERGLVLWIDAGGRIAKPTGLSNSLDWISARGFGCRNSEDDIQRWTHPAQLKYFRANTEGIKKQRNCDASVFGFTLHKYTELVRPWYECSITRQCIGPDGSDRWNHRQDQAALSVLTALTGNKCQGIDKYIKRHMDNYETESYMGVDRTKCYVDPIVV